MPRRCAGSAPLERRVVQTIGSSAVEPTFPVFPDVRCWAFYGRSSPPNRKFESSSLQRRVCELLVPELRNRYPSRSLRSVHRPCASTSTHPEARNKTPFAMSCAGNRFPAHSREVARRDGFVCSERRRADDLPAVPLGNRGRNTVLTGGGLWCCSSSCARCR